MLRRPRHVKLGDKRRPLDRLLQDSTTRHGTVEVSYAPQFKTFWKAERDGFIDAEGNLTEKGARRLMEFRKS